MKIKLLTTLVLYIGLSYHLAAQQDFPKDVPTPNAAALGKYGDVPVSLYSGQVNVSVPLYSMDVKGLEMPIEMTYDARGVQLNTLPSWTGDNWTLNAGGVIVRSVKGRADELIFPKRIVEAARSLNGDMHFPVPESYFQCHDTINTYFDNPSLRSDSLFSHIYFNSFDLEPDMFSFNFMGHTGKFYLGNDGEWKIDSDENIDVIFDTNLSSNYARPFVEKYPAYNNNGHPEDDAYQPKTIFGFKLRDDKGYIYEFGYNTDAIEYTTPFFCASNREDEHSWIANSWYLTKVSDKFGNELYNLRYRRGCFTTQIYNEEGWNYWEAQTHSFWGNASMTGGSESPSHEFPYGLQLNAPVYLDKIITSSGIEVRFASSLSQSLSMSNLYSEFCHDAQIGTNRNLHYHCNKYNPNSLFNTLEQPFYYLQNSLFSQFHANRNSSDYSALDYSNTSQLLARTGLEKLNSIVIIPNTTSTGLSYSKCRKFLFSYDFDKRMHLTRIRETCGPEDASSAKVYHFEYQDYDKLPSNYLTRAVDHWGYFNNTEYVCPISWDNVTSYYSQRDPNSTYMKYGSLKRIIYPTGGVTVFDFEPNEYSSVLARDRQDMSQEHGIGCGLRIKSISEYDDTTCRVLLNKKSYRYINSSTGLSSGQLFAAPVYSWPNWFAPANFNLSVSTFKTSSIVPLSNSFGPCIGYSCVEEKQLDGSKAIWEYTNYSDFGDDMLIDSRFNSQTPSPFDRFCERGYGRGKIKSIIYYNGLNEKVKSTHYNYRTDLTDAEVVHNHSILAANLTVQQAGGYYYAGRFYRINFPKYDVVETLDTVFTQTGNAISKIHYDRSDYDLDMSDGHKTKVRLLDRTQMLRYSNNNQSNNSSIVNLYPQLSNTSTIHSLAASKFDLTPIASITYHNGVFIKCDSIIFSPEFDANRTLLPKYYITRYPTCVDTTAIALSYDASKSLTRYQDAGGQKRQLYWAHNGCYLACVALLPHSVSSGPNYNFDDNVLFSSAGMKNFVYDKIRSHPHSIMSFYSYHPLYGVMSKTDSDLTTTYFEYDYFSRLKSIKDDNLNILNQFQYGYKIKF